MSVFDTYGKYYDLLNDAKDYEVEANYVLGLLGDMANAAPRILELGCGTGGHAFPLVERGSTVRGIDQSSSMVERAVTRRRRLTNAQAARVDFVTADLRDYRADEVFDAVISLFHVICYQTENADVESAFQTARAHLQPDGLFVFDCWYGPAVLTDRPYVRSREYQSQAFTATRTATPTLHANRNMVQVDFDFVVNDASGKTVDRFAEEHWLRYLFLPEIHFFLDRCGFELLNTYRWMTTEAPSTDSWYAVIVAKAV